MKRLPIELGRTPLTDPRSVGSALLFHGLLILAASAVALTVALPQGTAAPRVLKGEVGPVENAAPAASEGGGSPGELGGVGVAESLLSGTTQSNQPAPAESLLAEVLPTPATPESGQEPLPGLGTAGIGLLPGPGRGGGGGSGGGSGGGVGRGIGPGTAFFGAQEQAGSFAYVIDCSGSMASQHALDVAKRELLASLSHLPPDARFGIVFYNLHATVLPDEHGRDALMRATAANKTRVRALLTDPTKIIPDGGTDHMVAIRAGLALHPEVIFFLTDGDLMTLDDVDELLRESGPTRIQAIEFGRGADPDGSGPLKKLAVATGGTYRYIDVHSFSMRRY